MVLSAVSVRFRELDLGGTPGITRSGSGDVSWCIVWDLVGLGDFWMSDLEDSVCLLFGRGRWNLEESQGSS